MPKELEVRMQVFRIRPERLTKQQLILEIIECINGCCKSLNNATEKEVSYYNEQIKKLNEFKGYIMPSSDNVEEYSV